MREKGKRTRKKSNAQTAWIWLIAQKGNYFITAEVVWY